MADSSNARLSLQRMASLRSIIPKFLDHFRGNRVIFIYYLDAIVEYLKITVIHTIGYMLLLPCDTFLLGFVLEILQLTLNLQFCNDFLRVGIEF